MRSYIFNICNISITDFVTKKWFQAEIQIKLMHHFSSIIPFLSAWDKTLKINFA